MMKSSSLLAELMKSVEYRDILNFYGSRVAERSGVLLMKHIYACVNVLDLLNARESAVLAYMIHPLYQNDKDMNQNFVKLITGRYDLYVVINVLEYRRAANAYLCKPHTDGWDIDIVREQVGGISPEVRDMLIADKWQNEKDFNLYHKDTHARSSQLSKYFSTWKTYLDETGERFAKIDKEFYK